MIELAEIDNISVHNAIVVYWTTGIQHLNEDVKKEILMTALEIDLFMARSDNFGVLLHDPVSGATASIDAPEEQPILDALARRGWQPTDIFTTHHHSDHVAANMALKDRFGLKITGPAAEAAKIPGLDNSVRGGDSFIFAGHRVDVIDTPGHTAGHICFHLPEDHLLFAADTLFALGCGRLFEGTPADMWRSLQKLKALPDETTVYFGHEYTLSNARFAVTIDPENAELKQRVQEIETLRAQNRFTAPSNLGVEKRTNPFLRPDDTGIRKQLGLESATDEQVFAEIRKRKDQF